VPPAPPTSHDANPYSAPAVAPDRDDPGLLTYAGRVALRLVGAWNLLVGSCFIYIIFSHLMTYIEINGKTDTAPWLFSERHVLLFIYSFPLAAASASSAAGLFLLRPWARRAERILLVLYVPLFFMDSMYELSRGGPRAAAFEAAVFLAAAIPFVVVAFAPVGSCYRDARPALIQDAPSS
jgi:hypothetical protein